MALELARIVGSFQLEVTAAKYFLELKRAAEAAGHKVEVNTAYRSREHQERLYDAYKARKFAPPIVAKPGKSAHERGLSVDLNVKKYPEFLAWLRANAHTFGFFETTPSEPWHWTFIKERVSK